MTTVFIISAPSGSGKSTLVNRIRTADPKLDFSISYTTRLPRGLERDGQSYHFISRSEFAQRIAADEFLEYEEVFGNFYGTHISALKKAEAAGHDLVLDIDVKGARQLKQRIPDAVSIFVLAPSREILEQRLRFRSEDSQEVIERRLREAANEIREYGQYDYIIVNEEVEESVRILTAIVTAARARRSRMERRMEPILATFDPVKGLQDA